MSAIDEVLEFSTMDGGCGCTMHGNGLCDACKQRLAAARREVAEMRERVATADAALLQSETFMEHLHANAPIETKWSQVMAARTHDMIRHALDARAALRGKGASS